MTVLVTTLAAVAATAAAAAAEAATAAAAAAEAATTAAAAAAEAAAWAIFLRTGLIDRQLTAAELDAIDLFSCDLGLFGRSHGHKRETARATGHFVHSDVNVGNGTELAEVRAELVFSRFEREISNV
jgi:pyruvate/2-oxoglutarate dehydrogenase complex dihydrolipoamide acyltransferase (E2) component